MNRINLPSLISTLAVQSTSKDDHLIINYIKSKLKNLDVKVQNDKYGNIYVTKGTSDTYPCMVCHVDTVHSIIPDYTYSLPLPQRTINGFIIYRAGDILFAFSETKVQQVGIGGDDKTGVYLCLQALTDMDVLKVVFYKDEEIGKIGSKYSIEHHKSWYNNCNFVIQPDRRENADFIVNSGGIRICSSEFTKAFEPLLKKYDYEKKVGLTSDIDTLVRGDIGISCVNISSGFYAPHTDNEIVSISDVNKAYNLIYDFIKEHGKSKFPYTYVQPIYDTYKNKKWYPHSGYPTEQTGYKSDLSTVFSVEGKHKSFELSVANPKHYAYKGYNALKVEKHKCPVCLRKDVTFFLPYEEKFYCTRCNNYVKLDTNTECYRKLIVDDDSHKFVFSWVANAWYLIGDTVWHDGVQSYVLKDEYSKWEEQMNT